MKSLTLKILIIASFLFSGCTIHLHNTKHGGGRTAEEWHHDGVFRLVEFSEPVDLNNRCPGGWSEVTTEKKPVQVLVTVLSFSLYDPWNVQYVCASTPASEHRASEAAPAKAPHKAKPKHGKKKKTT